MHAKGNVNCIICVLHPFIIMFVFRSYKSFYYYWLSAPHRNPGEGWFSSRDIPLLVSLNRIISIKLQVHLEDHVFLSLVYINSLKYNHRNDTKLDISLAPWRFGKPCFNILRACFHIMFSDI